MTSLFAPEEYRRRIRESQRRMSAAGVDVLLIASPENINYLTGYAGWSFYTPQLAMLPVDADEPVLVLRAMDVACADFTVFLSPSNVVGYPETWIGSAAHHPMEFMAQFVRERGWQRWRLGIEKCAHFFSVRAYEILREQLPDATFVDADLLVDWVRLVKSDPEIAIMRQAGVLAGCAMRAAVDRIAPGVRECDAAAALYHGQLAGTSGFGGSVPNSVLMATGEKTRAPHLKWTDDCFRTNEAVTIELSGSRHQYHCALARTVYLGKPPAALLGVAKTVEDGMAAVLDRARPGVVCEELVATWAQVIAQQGLQKSSRIGYSIGLCFQPTWLERTVSLQQGERTELATNMTFHLMCGMWEGKDKFVMSETFRVTDGNVELLTDFPRVLVVKAA
jgi:ectoine hydrolase